MLFHAYLLVLLAIGCVAWIGYFFSMLTTLQVRKTVDEGSNLQKVAIVYAGRSFHEEVTASMACMLQQLDFKVIVYIDSGFSMEGWVLPFTQKRLYSSQTMYGSCVSQFITINSGIDIIPNPEVLMFITYPVNPDGHDVEKNAFKLLNKLQEKRHDRTRLMLVVHHAETIWQPFRHFAPYFTLNQTTFLCLAEHTHKYAKLAIADRPADIRAVTPDSAYDVKYIYPVFFVDRISGAQPVVDSHLILTPNFQTSALPVTYSIQGNFGGVHSKRKNINGTIQCMKALETPGGQQTDFEKKNLRKLSTTAPVKSVQLDLVGHVNGDLRLNQYNPPPHLQIRSVSNLAHKEFYGAITNTHFLVGALGNPAYTSTQASSSIPAALIAGVPLVLGADILALYPCVRDAPMHRFVNSYGECEAILRAFKLSVEQYSVMRQEATQCSKQLWDESVATLNASLHM